MSVSAPARLLRGFATDFLSAHDAGAAARIMDERYRLSIGGHLFDGRDASYLPATVAQLDQFPGLVVTVHDVVLSDEAVAMRFTEHGVSVRDGAAAAWGGVNLFRIAGGQLAEGWAEEDYLARKRQLKDGAPDPVRAPHPAPWDEPVRAPDPDTERAVRDRLADPRTALRDAEEIASEGPRLADLVEPRTIALSMLFTAGPRAAFHAELRGAYRGGWRDVGCAGDEVALPIAGIVDVADGQVARIQLCADRLGLRRRLGGR